MNIKKILTYTFIWRLSLFAIPLLVVTLPNFFSVWGNFQGFRIISLAKEGYGTPNTFYSYSLFPFYPHLIRSLSTVFDYLTSGLIISNLCLFLSVVVFWKLLRLDFAPRTSHFALLALALFPSSFVLGAVYSESLFLLLTLCSFYLARKGNFVAAAIFAFFASYTRAAGLILWLSLIIEYFSQNGISKNSLLNPKLLSLAIPPVGALIYFNFLSINTSNFLIFLPSVPQKLVLLHQVFVRYLRMFLFMDHTSPLFVVVVTELLVGLISLLVIIFSHKSMRFSYWSYLTISYLIPTLWGSFSGFPRFMLVAFPLFIFLATWLEKAHPYHRYLYYSISSLLLVLNLLFFVQNIFVG